jgi:hypothetical protein
MTKTSPQVSSLVAPVPQLPSSLDRAQTLENKAKAEAQKWNTKNLGLRLGSDFLAAASAAVMVAPIITVIDKYDISPTPITQILNKQSLTFSSEESWKMHPDAPPSAHPSATPSNPSSAAHRPSSSPHHLP